ncbi:hypothetical protein LHYA1_G000885 [Lachnellula hyalina]|uniref:Uncharacterized protein n=1 Tax=Lachnellula hyalina TaxID=1316788 RepID=A0A8H8U2W5_9HELO|nr:uncharacterized protein LHYA1_G000885 [Lachnellula hyalina]TVY29696.1 hypothetical protein LHYA1_G000885 [Lachnellula hyalina]
MPPMTPLIRTMVQRRAMSIGARARSAVRNFEPHPFERYPTTQASQKADWGKHIRHVGDVSMFYFPALGLFLTWPLIAEKAMPNI